MRHQWASTAPFFRCCPGPAMPQSAASICWDISRNMLLCQQLSHCANQRWPASRRSEGEPLVGFQRFGVDMHQQSAWCAMWMQQAGAKVSAARCQCASLATNAPAFRCTECERRDRALARRSGPCAPWSWLTVHLHGINFGGRALASRRTSIRVYAGCRRAIRRSATCQCPGVPARQCAIVALQRHNKHV